MIELARAQLAAGEGERFEPAINEAIRHYCDTRKEVRYFSNDKTLSNQQRQNVVAGFQRILSEQKIRLHKLDIHIEEVKPGSPIERSHHEVHTKLSTGNAQQLHTVAECILPVFTWKNADGIEQRKPALVVAYTDLSKSEDTFDELPSDVFEEIDDFESVPLKSR